MRLTVLYREQSDHARAVSEFMSMLSRYYPGKTAELLDIDTRDGAAEASLHGVMQYPALIVTSFEGRVIQQWEGMPLPILDEVASMVVSQENALV